MDPPLHLGHSGHWVQVPVPDPLWRDVVLILVALTHKPGHEAEEAVSVHAGLEELPVDTCQGTRLPEQGQEKEKKEAGSGQVALGGPPSRVHGTSGGETPALPRAR